MDRIIEISLNIDTILGILPDQVHDNFRNPFMRVNRACRQEMIHQISSLTWIELRSLDHKHAGVIHRLAGRISFIDPFWTSIILHGGKAARVVLEFGQEAARSTRQHVNDVQILLSPYSYSSLLRLISDLGHSLVGIGSFKWHCVRLPLAHLDEVQVVREYLDCQTNMTVQTGSDGRDFSLYQDAPTHMETLLRFGRQIYYRNIDLRRDRTDASLLRIQSEFLYMSRSLASRAESVLREPYLWVPTILGSPNWISNQYARDWLAIMHTTHDYEVRTCYALIRLLVSDYACMIHHAPYLTKGYGRFVYEPRYTLFGITGAELIYYYRSVGLIIGCYNEMNPLAEDSFCGRARLRERLERKPHALTCASKLKPEKKHWEDDVTDAQIELLKCFPSEGR